MALLLVLISTTHLVIFSQARRWSSFVLWQLTLVGSFYTHLYFLPVGVPHAYLVPSQRDRQAFVDSAYKWVMYGAGLAALSPVVA